MKKYEILKDDFITLYNRELYRIRALLNFGDVKKGDLGGYIEKESNLSHRGSCWVYKNAKVCGSARVFENAKIFDNAEIYGNAKVYGNAKASGKAQIYDNAEVYGDAEVFDEAEVYGNASIHGRSEVYEYARVFGNANVYGHSEVCDKAQVYGDAEIPFYICSDKMRVNTTFDDIRFFAFTNAKSVTALLVDGKWLFNVGCQNLIDKDTFLDRIYSTDGGLADNPHRQQYLDILEIF